MTAIAKFKKGALVRSEPGNTRTELFLVSITSDEPADTLEGLLDDAKYGSFADDIRGYEVHAAVEA